ncbi:CaiB/BaiF CoA transferase family protein [Alicyclobacillus ferrooxydans]|uniref:Alpha-methylacyl-CoA racemase n=1 Tax=Alicyclobacillus ferrooxydans TaxID=471514 RepID=A0A0P9EMU8_9BACL|nr:CoA transferase [Alicyclobacillus ferrooxydans]KPV44731.1 hypothetical protein AN477_05410 [Alicyclobacillus ferrooxydans]
MLSHIRVIDFTRLLPGPYATLRLADLGAKVMKIEEPSGDPARYAGSDTAQPSAGPVFLANNRNKRSIVLDLKTQEGRDKARALASTADVVIESFRPGVADSLGIGYETLRQVRADIVYCSLTGYGQSGPLSQLGGHDLNYMARSGLLSQLTDSEGQPVIPSMQFADFIGGIAASEAILAALVTRDRTGRGAYLDISMTHALMGLLTNHALLHGKGQEDGLRVLTGQVVCYRLYRTKDGRSISVAALEPKFWKAFCTYFHREDWIPLQMSPAKDGNAVFEELQSLFASREFVEWVDICDALDGCIAPVFHVAEALSSDLANRHKAVFTLDSADWGPLVQVHTHAGGFAGEGPPQNPPPKLGDWQRTNRAEPSRP